MVIKFLFSVWTGCLVLLLTGMPAGPGLVVFSQQRSPAPAWLASLGKNLLLLLAFFQKPTIHARKRFFYVLFENSQATRWQNSSSFKEAKKGL